MNYAEYEEWLKKKITIQKDGGFQVRDDQLTPGNKLHQNDTLRPGDAGAGGGAVSACTTLTNPATGETFAIHPGQAVADLPDWARAQYETFMRVMGRAQPMCQGYARLTLRLMAADGAVEQEQILHEMHNHLVVTDCSRVEKKAHSEAWMYEEERQEGRAK